MSSSPRSKEKISDTWQSVFQIYIGYATLLSAIAAYIIIFVWLNGDYGGGFGPRSDYNKGKGIKYFNLHPLFMSTAFILCLPLSISSFELYPISRHNNKNIHALFNTVCFAFAAAGFYVIVDIHGYLHKAPDNKLCTSVHGICGYFIFCLLGIEYFGGFILYVLKLGGSWRGTLKPLHKRCGFFILMFGLAECCMGLVSHTHDEKHGWLQAAVLCIAFVMFGAVSFVTKFENKDDEDTPISKFGSVNYHDMTQ